MRKIQRHFILSFIAVLSLSCSADDSVTVPLFDGNSLLQNSIPLPETTKLLINGVYNVESGADSFGKSVVIKWTGKSFSVFTGKSFAYFILKGGIVDSSIIFEGYWRFAQESNTGLAFLKINLHEGGREILQGKIPAVPIIIRGTFGDRNSFSGSNLIFHYANAIRERVEPFYIIAHRGGGRNLDQLPESENSLGMMQIAESFGANAIEIDVRLTKDGIPIIFHDANLSPRLVIGEFAVGPIKNYTYAHLITLCTLKNGELIPTLEQALETVLTQTSLSLVWMDVKDPLAIPLIIKMQNDFSARASLLGRKVEFLIGLPDEDAINEYLKISPSKLAPSLNELDYDSVIQTNSTVWAPAWTEGPMTDQVKRMQNLGKRVFFWTVDAPEFIKVFLDEGAANGILSNYPSVVAYQYYVK
jgi:glycerophosphoryl diester phosphodiesterase